MLERVPDKAKLESTVAEAWQRHSQAVDAAWENDWQRLAPGADLLSGLWKKHLDRGYSKASDGLAVAQKMAGPPADLAATLREFMAEGNGDA